MPMVHIETEEGGPPAPAPAPTSDLWEPVIAQLPRFAMAAMTALTMLFGAVGTWLTTGGSGGDDDHVSAVEAAIVERLVQGDADDLSDEVGELRREISRAQERLSRIEAELGIGASSADPIPD